MTRIAKNILLAVSLISSLAYSAGDNGRVSSALYGGCLWDTDQSSVSVPGATLSGYACGVVPLRKSGGIWLEGGSELRLRRVFLSLGFSSVTMERYTGVSNPRLIYKNNAQTTIFNLSAGFTLLEYV